MSIIINSIVGAAVFGTATVLVNTMKKMENQCQTHPDILRLQKYSEELFDAFAVVSQMFNDTPDNFTHLHENMVLLIVLDEFIDAKENHLKQIWRQKSLKYMEIITKIVNTAKSVPHSKIVLDALNLILEEASNINNSIQNAITIRFKSPMSL